MRDFSVFEDEQLKTMHRMLKEVALDHRSQLDPPAALSSARRLIREIEGELHTRHVIQAAWSRKEKEEVRRNA